MAWLKLYHEALDIPGAIVYDEGARTCASESNSLYSPRIGAQRSSKPAHCPRAFACVEDSDGNDTQQ